VAPPGFALPADPDREVTVSAANLNAVIGTIGNDDVDDFHNRLGSIAWEKRDDQGVLQGGATFTVGGATVGPFACHDSNTIGDDDLNPVTVVDDTDGVVGPGLDQDPDAGQLELDRVCLGTYTITETVAPPDFLFDPDTTRSVTVSAAALSASVGTQGQDDEGTRDAAGQCTDDACDYHNRRGSLLIRKEGKDASTLDPTDLLGGASFLIIPNPFTGSGMLTVTDDDLNDSYAADGLICLNNVVPGTYQVSEATAPAGYKGESGSKPAVSSTQSCTGRQAANPDDQVGDVLFDNVPLSTIQVIFDSLANGQNGDATVASIACAQGGNTVPPNAENNNPDPARDDTNETYGNGSTTLEPGVYTCTIDIDP
jgi:hypothetical protein